MTLLAADLQHTDVADSCGVTDAADRDALLVGVTDRVAPGPQDHGGVMEAS